MIAVSEEVSSAISAGQAVVALESSIISHGLPAPAAVQVAMELEAAIRGRGAVPATIAVINGVPRVGLSVTEVEQLADPDVAVAKAGASDLAALIASRATAATTVSGTSALAARVGIEVFATGGIGGVHRGDSGDVSADLLALSRIPIAVVSAGPKCILDLERTAERLETLGVLVVGYATDELPAFYSRTSGLALEHRVDSAAEAAKLIQIRFDDLGQAGVLVANPVPARAEIPGAQLEPAIERAHRDAVRQGIRGKALTPFLLAALRDATAGRAVDCNRALAVANASLAGDIAVELARRERRERR